MVGAGHVGATTAQRLAEKGYADVVLLDVLEGIPQGKALDLLQSGPVQGYDARITGAGGYDASSGSDLAVITAGLPRRPGMSRDDLLLKNHEIVAGVTREIARRSPRCIIIVVSNPLDAMAHTAMEISGFPRERVVGMAGILDCARMRTLISVAMNVSVESVHAIVLGGHGDSMVPLPRFTTVAGVPVTDLIPRGKIEEIVQRTRDGGAEIVKHLKSGSAYYAPAAGVVEMIDAILMDRKKILPCSAYLQGEYGLEGLFVGVPVKLGARGVEQIVELPLDDQERALLHASADAVRALLKVVGI